MDERLGQEFARMERRCRTLTGIVLGVIAFMATYGLMLFEGQLDRLAFMFYPWLLGLLFYFAGDLLALLWFRTITAQLQRMQEQLLRQQAAERAEAEEALLAGMPQDQVEIIRPGARGGG